MRRDISWFDREENTTGSLSAMLSLDAKNVKAVCRVYLMYPWITTSFWIYSLLQGTGIRLGIIVLAISSIVAALVVCFTGSWELTFILFIAIPLFMISYRVAFAMYSGVQSSADGSLAKASHIVTETVGSIKTVVSLGAEEYFVNCIKNYLASHLK